jgi:hypothetical protein
MLRRKCLKVKNLESILDQAVLGVQSRMYQAAKQLNLCKDTIPRRVKGGLSRSQPGQQQ